MTSKCVHLLSRTAGYDAIIDAIWKASRSDDPVESIIISEVDSDNVKKVIESSVPVSEAINFTFLIEDVPVYVREDLVLYKYASFWAQSSRARDLSKFDDKYIKFPGIDYVIYSKVLENIDKLKSLGVHQDDFRLLYPMSMTSRISMTIDYRNLCIMLSDWSKLVQKSTVWEDILCGICDCVRDSTGIDLKSKYRVEFTNLEAVCNAGNDVEYRSISCSYNHRDHYSLLYMHSIPLVLKAQLIRHRSIDVYEQDSLLRSYRSFYIPESILDNSEANSVYRDTIELYCSKLPDCYTLDYMCAFTPMAVNVHYMSIGARNSVFKDMLMKRVCHIAQGSLWSTLINTLSMGNNIQRPCKGNGKDCKCIPDNILRLEGKDPSKPCPIWLSSKDAK